MNWTETTARRHEKRYRFDGIHFITCLAVAWYLSIWPVSLMLLHQPGDNHAITYVLVNQALKMWPNNPVLLAITNCVISIKGYQTVSIFHGSYFICRSIEISSRWCAFLQKSRVLVTSYWKFAMCKIRSIFDQIRNLLNSVHDIW